MTNKKGIKITDAIEIVKENLTDGQIDFILNDFLWDESIFDIQTRINAITGFKKIVVEEN